MNDRQNNPQLQRGLGSKAEEGGGPDRDSAERLRASTGPRLEGRGRLRTWPGSPRFAALQRGLGSKAEEGNPRGNGTPPLFVLQRGLGSKAEEGARTARASA